MTEHLTISNLDRKSDESLQTELKVLRQKVFCYEQVAAEFAILDRQMRYLAASRNWRDHYGLNGKDIIFSGDEIVPEISQRLQEIYEDCLAGKTDKYEEDFFVCLDGITQWLKWEINPWYDDNGEVGGLIIIQELITAENSNSSKLVQRLLNLQFSVTEILAESVSLEEAIPKLLQQASLYTLQLSPAIFVNANKQISN